MEYTLINDVNRKVEAEAAGGGVGVDGDEVVFWAVVKTLLRLLHLVEERAQIAIEADLREDVASDAVEVDVVA